MAKTARTRAALGLAPRNLQRRGWENKESLPHWMEPGRAARIEAAPPWSCCGDRNRSRGGRAGIHDRERRPGQRRPAARVRDKPAADSSCGSANARGREHHLRNQKRATAAVRDGCKIRDRRCSQLVFPPHRFFLFPLLFLFPFTFFHPGLAITCYQYKHVESLGQVGTDLTRTADCGEDVNSCVLFRGTYLLRGHPVVNMTKHFYDGGCGIRPQDRLYDSRTNLASDGQNHITEFTCNGTNMVLGQYWGRTPPCAVPEEANETVLEIDLNKTLNTTTTTTTQSLLDVETTTPPPFTYEMGGGPTMAESLMVQLYPERFYPPARQGTQHMTYCVWKDLAGMLAALTQAVSGNDTNGTNETNLTELFPAAGPALRRMEENDQEEPTLELDEGEVGVWPSTPGQPAVLARYLASEDPEGTGWMKNAHLANYDNETIWSWSTTDGPPEPGDTNAFADPSLATAQAGGDAGSATGKGSSATTAPAAGKMDSTAATRATAIAAGLSTSSTRPSGGNEEADSEQTTGPPMPPPSGGGENTDRTTARVSSLTSYRAATGVEAATGRVSGESLPKSAVVLEASGSADDTSAGPSSDSSAAGARLNGNPRSSSSAYYAAAEMAGGALLDSVLPVGAGGDEVGEDREEYAARLLQDVAGVLSLTPEPYYNYSSDSYFKEWEDHILCTTVSNATYYFNFPPWEEQCGDGITLTVRARDFQHVETFVFNISRNLVEYPYSQYELPFERNVVKQFKCLSPPQSVPLCFERAPEELATAPEPLDCLISYDAEICFGQNCNDAVRRSKPPTRFLWWLLPALLAVGLFAREASI